MNDTAKVEFDDFPTLLRRSGAKPARYGKRWDCPRCGRFGHVSVDLTRGVYHCWHAGCDFKGSARTLARSLGLSIPRAAEDGERRERARGAAYIIAGQLREWRWSLAERHRNLLDLKVAAEERLRLDSENDIAWTVLTHAYREVPRVRAELNYLETAPWAARIAFLQLDGTVREEIVDRLVEEGRDEF